MSQKDRQSAYAKALAHRDELAALIKASAATAAEQSRMVDLLSALWLQADRACGGEECRP